jgi:hypothetical protein
MKKLLTLSLALIALAVFIGLGEAQQTAGERKGPTQEVKHSECGKVTNINHRAMMFTITEATGKKATFDASVMKTLPTLGDTVVVAYIPGSGDPLKGLNVSKSK